MNNLLFSSVLSFGGKQMKVTNRSYKRPIFIVTSTYEMNDVCKLLFVVEKSNPVSAEQENQIGQDLAESTVFSFADSQEYCSLDDEDSQQTAHFGE